jgi:hypothetical protein
MGKSSKKRADGSKRTAANPHTMPNPIAAPDFRWKISLDTRKQLHQDADIVWNHKTCGSRTSAPSELYRLLTSLVFTLTGQVLGITHQNKKGV